MKVLVVTNMYPTEKHCFAGIFVKEQVESLRRNRIDVDVSVIKGFENRWNYLRDFVPLLKTLRSKRYDLIHTHHTFCVHMLTLATYILSIKLPIIITFHEGEVLRDESVTIGDADIIEKLLSSRKLKEFAVNKADLVISVYERLTHPLNVETDVVVLPCGVDLQLFRPIDKLQCRKRLSLPLFRKVVFFPADPSRKTEKGFDILEQALQILDISEVFLMTGGKIPHEEMPYYMNASDVIVQTSNFEASPMVIKEALAVSVPIVSTDAGDTREIIGNTHGCFICKRDPYDVADKLSRASRFPGRTNGRERITMLGLTLEQVAQDIVRLYERLLDIK